MPLSSSGSALFAGSAEEFISMAPASNLTEYLTSHLTRLYGKPGESEVRAWRNSLTAMAEVVEDPSSKKKGTWLHTVCRVPQDAEILRRDRTLQLELASILYYPHDQLQAALVHRAYSW